ncbi:MAG: anti-sigma-factor antagonist [Acidimicrobiales bacterium]|jgi:anti-anti-sigma factor|nr:anti-sigma-factor antagonist [Acidimicrobiales bacterium]
MDDFGVTVDSAGDTALVRPLGELDLASAPAMGAALARLLRSDHRAVVMDLSRLTFSDCAGLRPVRRAIREARTQGTEIELRGALPAVRRVLELTGLATPASLV